MTRWARAALFARTVRYLRPLQVAHRVRLRAQRALIARIPLVGRVFRLGHRPAKLGWPRQFVPLDARTLSQWPSADLLSRGGIRLLGYETALTDWEATGKPQLWRYHLHYWDWAWALAVSTRSDAAPTYARLIESWRQSTTIGLGDAWSPYVAALRLWSWCGQYVHMGRCDPGLLDDIWVHGRYVRAHVELDVGGNHLVKDIKSLIGCGMFFAQPRLVETMLRRLRQEVARQILPDGGHYERAPAYHCQVLADLIDIAGLLDAAGRTPPWLQHTITRMRQFLGLVLLPDGCVPLLNDGYPVPPEVVELLQPGPEAPDGLTMLDHSGLAVLRMGPLFVLADIGAPCPDELPAHAHADTLSFLLYDGEDRIVTEAGTSTYAPGTRRSFERSTRAHSTVEIDGTDSTEVWGAFRAARRARVTGLAQHSADDTVVLAAQHDGYRRLPGAPIHRRTWRLSPQQLRVHDEVRGRGRHEIATRVVLAPDAPASAADRFGPQWNSEAVSVAEGWERLRTSRVLTRRVLTTLPWRQQFRYISAEKEQARREAGCPTGARRSGQRP